MSKRLYWIKGTISGFIIGLIIWILIFIMNSVNANIFHLPYLEEGNINLKLSIFSLIIFSLSGYAGGEIYRKLKDNSKKYDLVFGYGEIGLFITLIVLYLASLLGRVLSNEPFILPKENKTIVIIIISIMGYVIGAGIGYLCKKWKE